MNIQLNQPVGFSKNKPSYLFLRGVMDILPLSISVIPWAILAGSMAIHAGLSFYKALQCLDSSLLELLSWLV